MESLHDKNYTFELYVKQIEYEVESKKLVNFLWKSGNSEYRSQNTPVYPGLKKHKIDEELVLHYVFKEGQDHLTHFKAFDVTDPSNEILLGECEIDLTKLLNVTNPFKFRLLNREGKRMAVHSYVNANPKLSEGDARGLLTSKSGLSMKKEDYLPMNKSFVPSVHGSYAHSNLSDDDHIYDKINRMSNKLSHIERAIMKKTVKLNLLNRENVEEMTKIKTRLEKDIKKKDLQIKLLINQLDELHASLALSHQREIELAESAQFAQLQDEFYNTLDLNCGDRTNVPRHYLGESGYGYNRSIMNELETNINELNRFKQDYESLNDPGKKISQFREIIGNLEKIKKMPKYLSSNSSSSSSVRTWNEYANERDEIGSLRRDLLNKHPVTLKESLAGRDARMARDRVPLNNSCVLDGFKGARAEMGPEILKSGQLRTGRKLGLAKGPRLLAGKESPMSYCNGGVFIPNTAASSPRGSNRKVALKKGYSMRSGSGSTDRASTICGLERELVETKVKLADSETKKEHYLNELRGVGVEITL